MTKRKMNLREIMEHLLAGESLNVYYPTGELQKYSPFKLDKDGNLIDKDADPENASMFFCINDIEIEIIEPKIKYLKPLHVVLAEAKSYSLWEDGDIYLTQPNGAIVPEMFPYFGKPFKDADKNYKYHDSWIEEK